MPIVVEEVQAEVDAPPPALATPAAPPPPASPEELARELCRLLGRAERLFAD